MFAYDSRFGYNGAETITECAAKIKEAFFMNQKMTGSFADAGTDKPPASATSSPLRSFDFNRSALNALINEYSFNAPSKVKFDAKVKGELEKCLGWKYSNMTWKVNVEGEYWMENDFAWVAPWAARGWFFFIFNHVPFF